MQQSEFISAHHLPGLCVGQLVAVGTHTHSEWMESLQAGQSVNSKTSAGFDSINRKQSDVPDEVSVPSHGVLQLLQEGQITGVSRSQTLFILRGKRAAISHCFHTVVSGFTAA